MGLMSALRRLAMRSIMLLRHRSGDRRMKAMIDELHEWELLNDDALSSKQQQRLAQLLRHAFRHVPYYRRILNEYGVVDAHEHVDIKRFSGIPILTKDAIRANWEALKSDDLAGRQWYYNASGGSTGELIRLIQDRAYDESVTAIKMFFDEWSGYRSGERKVFLWGSRRDLLVGAEGWKARVLRWLNDELWLNAYRMSEAQMRAYVEQINRFKPVQILAYADSVDQLSRFIERYDLNVYSPTAVMTSAGTLLPEMRERIERVFRAPVFNRYGSREVGDMACECRRHQGLHVSPLTHYVEIVRPDGAAAAAGEVGEVVVTSLGNYAMPLLRYRIGDLAAWAHTPCDCGCRWPLLKEVMGRISDTFIAQDGVRVNGKYFHHLFYNREWIRRFQVIQEDVGFVRILIELADRNAVKEDYSKELGDLENNVITILGRDCRVGFEFPEEILPTRSGKYLYTISKLSNGQIAGR